MVKFIESELNHLREEVNHMWTLVYAQMELASKAVLSLDRNLAQQIVVRERWVDAEELKIDSEIEDFIALYTPVAVDLRFVLAMLKITSRDTAQSLFSIRDIWVRLMSMRSASCIWDKPRSFR